MSCDGFQPENHVASVAELNETYEEEMWTRDWLELFYRYEAADEEDARGSLCVQMKRMWEEYLSRETEEWQP